MDYVSLHLDVQQTLAVAMTTFDFSKAFDQIDHSLLITKLMSPTTPRAKVLPGDFLRWLQDYLTNRKQRTRILNATSDQTAVTSGVIQGSTLGPNIYSPFVADLQPIDPNNNMVKYADDTTLLVPISKNNREIDLKVLSLEILNIKSWSNKNNMCLNLNKCNIIYFKKRSPLFYELPSKINDISAVDTIKLLGVIMDPTLTFTTHFNQIIKRASQRLHILRVLKPMMGPKLLLSVYCALIRSLFEYASPIFLGISKSISSKLTSLQNRAHRIICGENCTKDCLPDLGDRRLTLARKMFTSMQVSDNHPLRTLLPERNPNRNQTLTLPTINTNRRRNTFIIQMILNENNLTRILD